MQRISPIPHSAHQSILSLPQLPPPRRRSFGLAKVIFTIVLTILIFLLLSPTIRLLADGSHQQEPPSSTAHSTEKQSRYAPGSISGLVLDTESRPIENVQVSLFPNDGWNIEQTVHTASDGTYRFNFLNAGLYRLGFSDPTQRYLTEFYSDKAFLATADTIFVASNDVQADDVRLDMAGTIAGTVRTESEHILSDVSLSVHRVVDETEPPVLEQGPRPSIQVGTPTNAISYTVSGLYEGLYRVCARSVISTTGVPSANCYGGVTTTVQTAQSITVSQGMTTTNIDIFLPVSEFGTISGTVTSALGFPLNEIYVTAHRMEDSGAWSATSTQSKTDSNGTYQIKNLRPGIYTLSFQSYKYFLYRPELLGNVHEFEDARKLEVHSGKIISGADIAIFGPAISGTVTSASGEPVEGIDVYPSLVGAETQEYSKPAPIRTDQNGRYEALLFTPGEWTLLFENHEDEYVNEYLGNAWEMEEATVLTLTKADVRQDVDFVVRRGATVTGTVTLDGQPLNQQYRVEAYLRSGEEWSQVNVSAVKDDNGVFSLKGLAPGRYKFAVTAEFAGTELYHCYGSKSLETATEVALDVGDVISNIDIALETNIFEGALGGQITFSSQPVEGIEVAIDRKPDGHHKPTIILKTDTDGRFYVDGVAPGNYCIRFSDPDGVYATNNYGYYSLSGSCNRFILDVGEVRSNIDHRLELGGSISGTLSDYNDGAVDTIQVTVYTYDNRLDRWFNTYITTMVDARGAYKVAGLLPSTYRLGFHNVASQSSPDGASEFYGRGSRVEAASDITVHAGETTTGIDFVLGGLDQILPAIYFPLSMH